MQNLYATMAGLFVGLLFSWLKLPLPAPATLTGILGGAGVFLGSVLYNYLLELLGIR